MTKEVLRLLDNLKKFVNRDSLPFKNDFEESIIAYITEIENIIKKGNIDDNWISVDSKLPDCHSKHNKSYASGYVLTYSTVTFDWEINQYWEHGEYDANGIWHKTSENWESDNVTHWRELTMPLKY